MEGLLQDCPRRPTRGWNAPRSMAISSRLVSRRRMFDSDLHHEYWRLLEERFTDLTPKQRGSVIEGHSWSGTVCVQEPAWTLRA